MRPGDARWRLCSLLAWTFWAVGAATAADGANRENAPLTPRILGRGGYIVGAADHNFYVESQWQYPLWARDGWFAAIEHRDSSPFLDTGGLFGNQFQVEQIHATESLRVERRLSPVLSLKTLQRYQHTMSADRPGKFFAFESLMGIGTPDRADAPQPFQWEILAGAVRKIRAVEADWAMVGRASWRVWRHAPPGWASNGDCWGLSLEAQMESVNDGEKLRPRFEAGPTLRFPTLGGNAVSLLAHWIQNSGNPLSFDSDGGALLAVQIESRSGPQWGHDWLEFQAGRLLPAAWGRHEFGAGHDNIVSLFETGISLAQFNFARRPTTLYLWYQHRQEYRDGDFDNSSYSVFLGPQTPLTIPLLSSWLARDEPLIFALDYFHRSDHALDPPLARLSPDNSRLTAKGRFLVHGSVNIWRARLQTAGFDSPYRYKSHYDPKTRWLGTVDWRVMLGGASQADRARGNPACQIAATVDIASVQGVVLYARGLLSWNEESPDSYIEAGLKRPMGKIFWRYETYGIRRQISRGAVNYVGFGLNL